MKLSSGSRHLMTLIAKDRNAEGWATVSRVVWPLILELPPTLVEIKATKGGGGFARLTQAGETVLAWT